MVASYTYKSHNTGKKGKIGVGFIGAGIIAWVHAEILSQQREVQLVGVADIVEQKAKKMADAFDMEYYTDFHKLLEKPGLNAVWLAVPPSERGKITLEIVKAGKHIMTEKPIGWSLRETNEIINAIQDKNVKLMVGYSKRFAPRFTIPKEMIRKGELGAPIWCLAYYNIIPLDQPEKTWYGDVRKSGGLVVENTIHYIDLIKWFIESPITKVYANLAKLLPRRTTVEDSGAIILHFKKPVIAMIACGSNAPENFPDEEFKLIGTKGAFESSAQMQKNIKTGELKVYSNKLPFVQHWYFPMSEGYKEEDIYFTDCIKSGKDPIPSAKDGRDSLEAALAAMLSAKTGKIVKLPLDECIGVPDLFPLPWGP